MTIRLEERSGRMTIPFEERSGRITTRFVRNALSTLSYVTVLLIAAPTLAHHIMGIPHYSYDEQYPQTPILTYVVELGPHEVRMTGYPGIPNPGERCTLHVYIVEIDGGAPFVGDVTLTAFRDRLLAQDEAIYGPARAELEERVYKFYPEFEHEANYYRRLEYEAEGVPWIIDLPMVVGEPGSPWLTVGLVVGGMVLFVVVIRAIGIKRRRAARRSARAVGAAVVDRGVAPQEAAGNAEALSS